MAVTVRALDHDDLQAWATLLAETEAVDQTGEHFSVADLEEELANPDIEVGKDFVGAFEGDAMVGYFSVYPRGVADGEHRILAEGGVHPDRRGRGIGTELIAAMVQRARAAHAERHPALPMKLMVTGLSRNTAQEELFAGVGLRPERWNFLMEVDLASLPEQARVPGGYAVRRYQPEMAERMMAAHNSAFLDHPNFTPWSDTMWRQWVTESRNFRPEISFVATPEGDPETIVGYVQSNEYDAHFEATGKREAFVAKVGTLREHRGRGVAGALLGRCLTAYREAGFDTAALDVDSLNPTGALGVYERAGFSVTTRWTNYAMVGAAEALTT